MQNLANIIVTSNAPLVEVESALDTANQQLNEGRIAPALDELFEDLLARREEKPETWAPYARACLDHPVRNLLHQDPFTYRAFPKPRGYAGDAVMMDYIYGLGEATEAAREATPLGRAIFNTWAEAFGSGRSLPPPTDRRLDRPCRRARRKQRARPSRRPPARGGAFPCCAHWKDTGFRRAGPGPSQPGSSEPGLCSSRHPYH